MNIKLLLKFTFLFVTIGCQSFVFSAQPSSGKNDQKEDKSVTSLSLSDLESEIKFVESECLPANETKEVNADDDVQDFEGYRFFESCPLFYHYQQSRVVRIKQLKNISNCVIPALESVISQGVSTLNGMLAKLDPDSNATYTRELDVFKQVLLCVSRYLETQLDGEKVRNQESLYFIERRLLPFVQACASRFSAASNEFNEMKDFDIEEQEKRLRVMNFFIGFKSTPVQESRACESRKKIDDLREKYDKDKQAMNKMQLNWSRVIKTMEELVKPR